MARDLHACTIMANIATSIVIPPVIFGYSTLAGGVIAKSDAPRGEVIFEEPSGAVTLAGVGDTQTVSVSLTLPANFAYVLKDLFFALQSNTDIADWDDTANVSYRTAGDVVAIQIPLMSTGVAHFSGGQGIRMYDWTHLPTGLTRAAGDASMSVNLANLVTNGEAASVRFYARFLQYDVSQHHDVEVNRPTLIR